MRAVVWPEHWCGWTLWGGCDAGLLVVGGLEQCGCAGALARRALVGLVGVAGGAALLKWGGGSCHSITYRIDRLSFFLATFRAENVRLLAA